MPIIWDVFPIITIYWLHLVNFSATVTARETFSDDEDESTRCMTGYMTYSEELDDVGFQVSSESFEEKRRIAVESKM